MPWSRAETSSMTEKRPARASSRISARLAPAQKWVPSCDTTSPFQPRWEATSSDPASTSRIAPSTGLKSGCSAEWNSTQPTPSSRSISEALQLRRISRREPRRSARRTAPGALGTGAIDSPPRSKKRRSPLRE